MGERAHYVCVPINKKLPLPLPVTPTTYEKGNITRTVPCYVVYDSCTQQYMHAVLKFMLS